MAQNSEFGTTAWGRWFAEALEGFDENGRLSRGKSYARSGKVFELEVKDRIVTAKVEGHSEPWYRVRIAFPPLSRAQADELRRMVEERPMLLARIEAGESPPELIEALKRSGVDLIPLTWNSMKRSCSCPDWGDPCKHMAAVYFILAKEIDRDPRLLFRLRGANLLAGAQDGAQDAGRPLRPMESAALPREVPPSAPPTQRLSSYTNFVISLMPPSTAFSAEDFSVSLAEFYHTAAAAAAEQDEAAESAFEDDSTERLFARARYTIRIPAAVAEGRLSLVAAPQPIVRVEASGMKTVSFSLAALSSLFLGFSEPEGGEGYRFLFRLFRLLRDIRSAGAFIPWPVVDREGAKGRETLRIAWKPLPQAADLRESLSTLEAYDPGLLRVEGTTGFAIGGKDCVDALAQAWLTAWARSLAFEPRGMKAAQRELVGLFFGGTAIDISWPGERGLAKALSAWLSIYAIDFGKHRYRLTIDSKEPETCVFDLKLDVLVEGGDGGPARPISLKRAAEKLGPEVLQGPAALSSWLPELRELAERRKVQAPEERLSAFLGEAPAILAKLGIEVALPKYLRKCLDPKLVLKVGAGSTRALRSYLDIESVLEYDWRVAIGDRTMTIGEFRPLVAKHRSIVFFHDGFVRLDPEEVSRLLEHASEARRPTALEVLKARFTGQALFSADAEEITAALFKERDLEKPAGLAATLRPYQERGYRWIAANLLSGFGCILADDMGLGKTVQAIAVMQRFEEDGLLDDDVLVVAPAALLSNWQRELARFAPGLGARLYHGPGRTLEKGPRVLLTTFQTVLRDKKRLAERSFSLLVVDEAHILKNPAAKASAAVKSIRAAKRLALSGTPVENRLEDLRSIFDVVLPGYLGTASEFRRTWRVPIELDRDAGRAEELRKITAPFLMRRLKTDRSVISDLPEKIETDEYAGLAPEQAALYASVVEKGMADMEEAEDPSERQAVLLRLFTSLKQVCDHPRVYDKESPPLAALSGKCGLLLALLEELLAAREKVLVFSHYVETLRLLETVIRDSLGEESLIYHGGMSAARRDETVESFQNDTAQRIMLVSLKAGGLGLNLTAASRVIHYDLWFNPAVESQATDRAFRIGQTRNVFVHRFITQGTFEEKLDAMIKGKRELAEMSVAAGESWLSTMSDSELRELFA